MLGAICTGSTGIRGGSNLHMKSNMNLNSFDLSSLFSSKILEDLLQLLVLVLHLLKCTVVHVI